MELTTRGSLVHSQALAMFAGTDSMGLRDDNRDQRLRPLPNNSECEPKRTNSIALLFLSNQIKSVSFSIWHPYSSSSCLSKNEDYILPVSDCLLPKA